MLFKNYNFGGFIMIRNNNIDYDKVIGLEEANRILEILKDIIQGYLMD